MFFVELVVFFVKLVVLFVKLVVFFVKLVVFFLGNRCIQYGTMVQWYSSGVH